MKGDDLLDELSLWEPELGPVGNLDQGKHERNLDKYAHNCCNCRS